MQVQIDSSFFCDGVGRWTFISGSIVTFLPPKNYFPLLEKQRFENKLIVGNYYNLLFLKTVALRFNTLLKKRMFFGSHSFSLLETKKR